MDRTGLRKGVLIGLGCSGVSMVINGFSRSFAVYLVGAVFAGFGYALAGLVTISVVLSRWFITRRTFAVGLSVMGTGAASVTLPPLVTFLASRFALPFAFFTGALIMVAVGVLIFLLLPEDPARKGLEPVNDGPTETQRTGGAAVTADSQVMLFVYAAMFTMAFATYGVIPNLALLFTSEGMDAATAALLLSLSGVTLSIGKGVFGIAADKLGVRTSILAAYLLYLSGVVLCCFCGTSAGTALAVAGCLVNGLGNSLTTVGQPALASVLAKPEDYAVTVKRIQLSYMLGSVLIGPLPGMIADALGSYVPAYAIFAALVALSMCFILLSFRSRKRQLAAA